MKNQTALLLITSVLMIGCRATDQTSFNNAQAIDEDAFQVESIVTQIDDASEDTADDLDSAASSASAKVSSDGCEVLSENSSQHIFNLVNQPLFNSRVLVSGEVSRLYNNANCSIANDNDSFVREHSLSFSKAYTSATLKTTSADQTNYLGETIGGGASVLNTSAGYQLEIMGNNVELIGLRGNQMFDVSLSTLQPYVIEGTLRRSGRRVVSGQLKIDHNLAKYTAVWTSSNIQWGADCNCPVSGLLEVDYSGRRTCGASIEFKSCGVATFTSDAGRVKELKMPRCSKE